MRTWNAGMHAELELICKAIVLPSYSLLDEVAAFHESGSICVLLTLFVALTVEKQLWKLQSARPITVNRDMQD
jgi:hypothetical protein